MRFIARVTLCVKIPIEDEKDKSPEELYIEGTNKLAEAIHHIPDLDVVDAVWMEEDGFVCPYDETSSVGAIPVKRSPADSIPLNEAYGQIVTVLTLTKQMHVFALHRNKNGDYVYTPKPHGGSK